MKRKDKNEEPPVATQDEIDAALRRANAEDGEQPPAVGEPGGAALQPDTVKRKRRTVLEIFADERQEHADAVARTDAAVLQAQREHESAIEAQEQFLAKARAAFGL